MNKKNRPPGYWKDRKNIEQEIRQLIEKLRHFPTAREMREEGVPNLPRVAIREFGSFGEVRKYFGCVSENNKHSRGYWNNPENIRLEAREFLDANPELDTIPNDNVLRTQGYSMLGAAIGKNYIGGFEQLRLDLGLQKARYTKKNQWKNLDFTLEEARRIMQERSLETLPDNVTLQKLGCSSLSLAITKYHGGFRKFRNILGEEQIEREKRVWKDLDFAINQTREAMTKEGWQDLPPHAQLVERGYSALTNAIQSYHGGYVKFRQTLHENLGISPQQSQSLLEQYIGGSSNE